MSAEMWQVLDQAIELKIGERTFKARLLPIKSVFAWAEAEAVSEALANIQKVSSVLEGKDKVAYLVEATMAAIPKGMQLMEQAKELLYSLKAVEELLFQALVKDQPSITREEIKSLIVEHSEGLDSIIKLLINGGSEKK